MESNCETAQNTLHWHMPADPCGAEVVEYRVYFKPAINEPYLLIGSFAPADTVLLQTNLASVAGCYYVTAVDSAQNESAPSVEQCADNCPQYSLPDVFTPNNDGVNDVFSPFPYKYVQSVDMKIYNRWGSLVFETTDPDINWKGTVKNGDKSCSTGVYYYVCTVNELTLEGVKPRQLTGTVTLLMVEPVND